jgi:carboxypeptidase A2
VIALTGLIPPVGAQDVDPPVDYTNYKLVEVDLATQAELDTMLSISDRFLACIPGLGVQTFVVAPERMDDLALSGLRYEVVHENVQQLIDEERAAMERAGRGWFDNYKTYNEVNAYLDTLVSLRPDLASKFEVGRSLQNRPIYGIRITGPNAPSDRPAFIFHGCQHAREWISVMVPMYAADRLIQTYDSDPTVKRLVNGCVFYIVPIVNPDGYEYTHTNDRLWRKNRRNNGGGCYGVDLNRNWGVGWGGEGSSGNPCSETYRGTAAFSEPETQAMRNFITARPQIKAHIDFHSYSQLVMSPWGYRSGYPSGEDGQKFDYLDTAMAQAIRNVHGQYYGSGPVYNTIYPAAGIANDWTYGDRRIFGFAIELRDTGRYGFLLPPDQIIPTSQENFAAISLLAQWVIDNFGSRECPGDLNGDRQRDQADLAILLAAYGANAGGDIDGDGDTDQADLAILLANYGVACP